MRIILMSLLTGLLSISLFNAARWLPVSDSTDDLVFWVSYMLWPSLVFMLSAWLMTRKSWQSVWKVPLVIVAGIVIHSCFFLMTLNWASYLFLQVPTYGTIGAALVGLLMGWGMELDRKGLGLIVLRSTFAGFVSSLLADLVLIVIGNTVEGDGRGLAYMMVSVIFLWQFGTGIAVMWPLKRPKGKAPAN